MIDVQLKDIVNGLETFQYLMGVSMPSKTAYQIARLAREISKEYKVWEETRLTLIKKYGVKDENGELKIDENNQWTIDNTFADIFTKEINELLETQIQINANKIKLDNLDCLLNPNQMMNLIAFIEE